MKTYQCSICSTRVFFENLQCLACGAELGYVADSDTMRAMPNVNAQVNAQDAVDNEAAAVWQPCVNRQAIGCNWLARPVPQSGIERPEATAAGLCDCCRYTRTVPSLDDAANQQAWRRLEQAKRYL